MSNARGGSSPLPDAPWSGLTRADDRDALTRVALNHRNGAPLTALAQEAFGVDAVTGGANYQLARRTYQRHGDLFKTARRDGYVWVEPTSTLCQRASLDTASKHTVETQDGDGVAMSNAEAMLRRRQTFDGPGERGDLLGAFGAKREATEDRFHVLQDTFDPENHRLIPYSTRFNSVERVREIRDRYRTAWDRAGERYDKGVVATLTTDPSQYDSLAGMCEGLLDDVNALKDWLAYSPEDGPARAGERPPSVVSVEFTDDGKPHVHVAFFGVGWLAEHSALSRYWSESRDRGEVAETNTDPDRPACSVKGRVETVETATVGAAREEGLVACGRCFRAGRERDLPAEVAVVLDAHATAYHAPTSDGKRCNYPAEGEGVVVLVQRSKAEKAGLTPCNKCYGAAAGEGVENPCPICGEVGVGEYLAAHIRAEHDAQDVSR